ncbi:MAG: Flp family type IVb pilin [Syntrophales bacterium]|nr:Flp family type IVb pilin [Syntrophales bacterium]MDD5641164.1 Flp family type IVb pilin [Syntrophales bacterium]
MHPIRRILASGFWTDTEAAVATEYALMVGLIAMAIFAAVTLFGTNLGNLYANAVDKLPF